MSSSDPWCSRQASSSDQSSTVLPLYGAAYTGHSAFFKTVQNNKILVLSMY